jgi:hypothetical protein
MAGTFMKICQENPNLINSDKISVTLHEDRSSERFIVAGDINSP